jgi:hypothetical protein
VAVRYALATGYLLPRLRRSVFNDPTIYFGQALDQFGRQILVKEEIHASTTIKRFSRSAA